MNKLRYSTLALFLVCLASINVAIVLPAFHDPRAARDLRRAAFDAPAEEAGELRAKARAISRAEKRLILAFGATVAALSGAILGWRIYRCGGFSAALWQVHPDVPSTL